MQSVGLDIVSVARVERALERYGERFVRRILGPDEQRQLLSRKDRGQFVAGRFAAKEAVVKALSDLLEDRPPLRELQVVKTRSGKPAVILPRSARERLGAAQLFISITHERQFAAAVAIIAEEK